MCVCVIVIMLTSKFFSSLLHNLGSFCGTFNTLNMTNNRWIQPVLLQLHLCGSNNRLFTSLHSFPIHVITHTHAHTYTHARMHTHTHTHMHVCTHTRTHRVYSENSLTCMPTVTLKRFSLESPLTMKMLGPGCSKR